MREQRERILVRELVAEAMGLVMPSIMFMVETATVNRNHLAIVVLDPMELRKESMQPSVLYRLNIGDKKEWEYSYDIIANKKALHSFDYKCNTSEIKNNRPFLLGHYGVPHAGGVYQDGLVVGVSGVEDYFDEMIAYMIIASIRALCKREMEKVVNPADVCFVHEVYKKIE